MNVAPAFMPPTWVILAFYVIHYDISLVPAVIIGATFATFGRVILALLSRNFLRPYLPKGSQENFNYLGEFLKKKGRLTVPILIAYAFIPIPSNHIYITAGLARANLKMIATAFCVGRLISYSFWVTLADKAANNLDGIFAAHFSKTNALIAEGISLLIIVLISLINWKKVIQKFH